MRCSFHPSKAGFLNTGEQQGLGPYVRFGGRVRCGSMRQLRDE
jgi:hypothetical protein